MKDRFAYMIEYNQRESVKKRKKELRDKPENKLKKKVYNKLYHERHRSKIKKINNSFNNLSDKEQLKRMNELSKEICEDLENGKTK